MLRTLVASASFGLFVILAACSSDASETGATVTCAATDTSCRCSAKTFTLEAGERIVSACEALSASTGDTGCCYDLSSDGTTESCECSKYICLKDRKNEECICGYYKAIPSDATVVASCSKNATDSLCCEESSVLGTSNACSCNGAFSSCETRPGYENAKTVTTCGVVPRACDAGKRSTRTCNGLEYRAPEPSSSSTSSGGGSSKPECTSDSSCSGKCSGSCYACRSGDCKCGYKGASGSCLY